MKLSFLLVGITLAAQTPAFEVASIKPTPSDAQCGMIQPMPGGGLRVECVNLKTILTWTYDVQNYQVSGGAAWVESQRWNIDAKPPSSESPETGPANFEEMNDTQRKQAMGLVRQRLKALLADRFQLTFHFETKEHTVYALTAAKNGPKLTVSEDKSGGFLKRGRQEITSRGAQIETLVRFLAIDLQRPVLDRTNLTGHYDFHLKWAPDSDPNGPSLFTAIQEQLGLRLESQKGPVEILVIDRAEKASGN